MLIVIPYRAAGCVVTSLAVATCSAKVSACPGPLKEGMEAQMCTASCKDRGQGEGMEGGHLPPGMVAGSRGWAISHCSWNQIWSRSRNRPRSQATESYW